MSLRGAEDAHALIEELHLISALPYVGEIVSGGSFF
jgi:hypothetical protein